MSYQSAFDDRFLGTVKRWIDRNGEIFVMIRYHASAGSKEFLLIDSFERFQEVVQNLPPRTCVIVFHDRQVPIRGKVDSELLARAQSHLPENTEWLAVDLQVTVIGKQSWIHHASGVGHEELYEELEDRRGHDVALGPYPPWLEDSDVVVSAVIPEVDGRVLSGIY